MRRLAVVPVLLGAGCLSASSSTTSPASTPAAVVAVSVAEPTPRDPMMPLAHQSESVAAFTQMLDRRLEAAADPAGVEKIDAAVRARFEKPMGVMITDMSGMTELTKSRGIIGILALIREMQHITVPVVNKHGATWVKMEADDLFVTHTSAKGLYAAGREMLDVVKKHNADTKDDSLKMGMGLGFGKVLDLGDDIWGDAVNTASKLGEDTAEPGEILITADFHAALLAEGEKAPECKLVEGAARKAKFAYYSCR